MGSPAARTLPAKVAARKRREAQAAASRLPERKCPAHEPEGQDQTEDEHQSEDQNASTSNVAESGQDSSLQQQQQQQQQQKQLNKEHMVANGWCPHQVHHLAQVHDADTFAYLSTLTQSPHRRAANHGHCSKRMACVAYNADLSSYTTRHTRPGCACIMVLTPYKQLVKVLKRGGIPLLSIKGDTDADAGCDLHICSRSRKSKYVAISHVWADGLGNPQLNGLPLCQIRRLQASLVALQEEFQNTNGNVLFWMDTLCIPVGQEERLLRQLQIDKMASIYKGAITSLVLDSELMSTALINTPVPIRPKENDSMAMDKGPRLTLESRARIVCSVWMSRSWTLQEGNLPPTITMQFQDCLLVLGRISELSGVYRERFVASRAHAGEDVEKQTDTGVLARPNVDNIRYEALSSSSDADQHAEPSSVECECIDIALQRSFYSTFFKDTTEFVTIWNELSGRSTTMPQDVPVIITNMMDFDNRKLFDYYDAGQMYQAIMVSMDKLPLSIFFNTGPRQDPDGNHHNRWVPAKVGDDTLTSYPVVTVHSSHHTYKHLGQFAGSMISVYTIDAVIPARSKLHLRSKGEDIVYVVEPSDSTSDQFDTRGFTSTCVIVENAASSDNSGTRRAACFYVQEDDAAECHGIRLGWNQLRQSLRFWNKPPLFRQTNMTFHRPLRLEQLASSQEAGPTHYENEYSIIPIKDPCNLNIKYDPIPKFSRLKRRSKGFLPTQRGEVSICEAICVILCVSLGIAGFIGCFQIPINPLWCLLIGFVFVIVLASLGDAAVALWYRLATWRYIWSYGAIARNAPRDGTA